MIERVVTDEDGKEHIWRLRENPKEALLQALASTIATVAKDGSNVVAGKRGNTVSTFYPAEDSSFQRAGVNEPFATIRAGVGTGVFGGSNRHVADLEASATTNQYAALVRGLFNFDTSAIAASDSISSATFSFKGHTKGNEGNGNPDVHVFWGASASPTSIVAGDFDDNQASGSLGSIAYASIDTSSPTPSGTYNNIALSSFTNINKGAGAYTKLGTGTQWDVLNSLSGYTWSASKNSYVIAYLVDQTGSADDPKLVVDHSAPANVLLQDINYTYDNVGNITQIHDTSNSHAAKTVNFSYDDLNRLTHASTTAATSTPYRELYTYNALGNLLDKTSQEGGGDARSIDLERSSSQYLTISDGAQTGLEPTSDFSISLWVKLEQLPSTAGGDMDLVVKAMGGGGDSGYRLFVTHGDDKLRLYHWNATVDTIDMSASAFFVSGDLGNWVHVAATDDIDGSIVMYKNGSPVSVTADSPRATTMTTGSNPFRIGAYSENSNSTVDGQVDDVRFWNRLLSGGEVSDLYDDPVSFNNGANLKGWWKFNGNYTDASGNSNTLSAVNSPTFTSDVPFAGETGGTSTTTYVYAGTSYANPHAVTSIGSTTYAYDNNGNLTSTGSWTYAWDYRNRLISAGNGVATTTYAYDHSDQRVRKITGSATTTYPVKFFDKVSRTVGATTTATTTAYIFAGSDLVATVQGDGTATTTSYIHSDHLGSTNVVTDANGSVVKTLDYYPFGDERIDNGTTTTARAYIGEYEDAETDLAYLNARYYDPARAGFLSQDPVFWEIGRTAIGKTIMANPQLSNSYAYAAGNPIAGKDADGRMVELITRPVFHGAGGHGFILITNTPGNAAKLVGVPVGITDPTRITLGGYASIESAPFANFGNLVKGANHPDDFNLDSSNYIERTQILAPAHYNGNQIAFENAILESYDKLDDDLGAYSLFGSPRLSGQSNSNNTATTILMGAGISKDFIRGYQPTTMLPYRTPGLGTAISNSQRQSVADGLRGIIKTLTAVRESLKRSLNN